MKIVKPDNMALLHRVVRLQGRDCLSVGMVAFFSLGPSQSAALRPEAELWQRWASIPGAPPGLDEGWPKPRGEFMVYGEACAPNGRAVRELVVSARVGALERSLRVRGDRHWGALGGCSEPQPFSRMPITPAFAFGGPGFDANPQGRGMPVAGALQSLPNVEDPSAPVVFASDRPEPAGFWGVESAAPSRMQHLGRTDAQWLRGDWPHLPRDTDREFFQAAPRAQRLPSGYFGGMEAVTLQNLHPDLPTLNGRLPGLRARCVVQRTLGATPDLSLLDVPARAETVWLLPGLGCGALLYRAVVELQDADARDVLTLVAAWEPLADEPASADALLAQALPPAKATSPGSNPSAKGATGDPQAAPGGGVSAESSGEAAAASAAQSLPSAGVLLSSAGGAAALEADPELAQIESLTQGMLSRTDALLAEAGLTRADLAARMRHETPAEPSLADIERLTAEMDAATDRLLAEQGMTRADIAAQMALLPPEPATLEQIQRMHVSMDAQRRALQAAHGLSDADVAAYAAQRTDTAALSHLATHPLPPPTLPTLSPGGVAAADAGTEVSSPMPRASDASPVAPAAREAAPLPLVRLTREQVVALHAQGASLAQKDLSGLDLSGLDLRAVDFRAADLSQARLDDAILEKACFDGAYLLGASLQRADMRGASFKGVRAHGADVSGARMNHADCSGADLSGARGRAACLEDARCDRTDFAGSEMPGLQAARLNAPGANFSECDLSDAAFVAAQLPAARFEQARMPRALFAGIQAAQSSWHGAQAERIDLQGADLSGSRAGFGSDFQQALMARAILDDANWSGANLQHVQFSHSMLRRADFSDVQARGARWQRVDGRAVDLSRADLRESDGCGSNLMGASLRRARLQAARLDGSNLHGSALEGSDIGRASTAEALLTATLLAVPGRAEGLA